MTAMPSGLGRLQEDADRADIIGGDMTLSPTVLASDAVVDVAHAAPSFNTKPHPMWSMDACCARQHNEGLRSMVERLWAARGDGRRGGESLQAAHDWQTALMKPGRPRGPMTVECGVSVEWAQEGVRQACVTGSCHCRLPGRRSG